MYNAELPDNLGDFGELLRRVLSGEEVILSQAGTPVASYNCHILAFF